ncbi:hypothetical protein [Chromobacterium piscinae]|uniref:hypothetical protein n=2 Tax=Chromobacterium piscinae TaxID=686831 RepID=UPI001C8B26D9|nr:hypothetical protein [Chromobacterium piscinae]MBX9298716.1 hypothetical protein [Chromobacterium vaccinii]MBX9357297.1 hypothetical protein [Chromobacterium vaccinii]MCD4503421.1 hypothetical protein [Chromobacterium piscinae]MCD5329201.1 hypothetical protein [Chromobacterium piscinae]
MLNLAKSILIVIFIALFQLSIYGFFVRPSITTWGATEKEISMPMAGDNKDLLVTATRAITINTSKAEVWKWLIQLGADRGGFYSYSFIEEALGYETRYQNAITPEFKEIKVGDLVRGSINEKHSIVPYSFKVLYVKPEESIVLDKWGTFLLKSISDEQTRLIVRSQEVANKKNIWMSISSYLEIPFHFIMERRLLMGIKARAEAGESVKLSPAKDIIWFSGVVISGFLICWFVYIAIGVVQSIVISSILSFFWMCSIWLVDPIPLYSVSMVLVVFIAIWVTIRSKRGGV